MLLPNFEIPPNEDATCSTDVYTMGGVNDDPNTWLNHDYAVMLGSQNLTYVTTPERSPLEPTATSTPKRKRSDVSKESLESIAEIAKCKDILFSECLLPEDVEILKSVLYLCLRKVVGRKIEDDCYGCTVDYPSQLQHSCLFEPPIFYFERFYETICEMLFTPELHRALAYGLHAIRGKTVSPYRILGAAEVIISDLRSEPYIIEKLDQASKDVLYKKSPDNTVINQSVDIWLPMRCMPDVYQVDV